MMFNNIVNMSDTVRFGGVFIHGAEEDGPCDSVSIASGSVWCPPGQIDVLAGYPNASPGGRQHAGRVYLICYRQDMPSTINASDAAILTIDGVSAGDQLGACVAFLEDDGRRSIIAGASGVDPSPDRYDAGRVYVLFSTHGSIPSSIDLSNLNGLNGSVINGAHSHDLLGGSCAVVSSMDAGDSKDILLGLPSAQNQAGVHEAGQAVLIFAPLHDWLPVIELSRLNGTDGVTIDGFGVNDRTGASVCDVGRWNGGDQNHVGIGIPGADSAGRLDSGQTCILRQRDAWEPHLRLPDPSNRSDLGTSNAGEIFCVRGAAVGGGLGAHLSGSGHDGRYGRDGILIGSRSHPNVPWAGRADYLPGDSSPHQVAQQLAPDRSIGLTAAFTVPDRDVVHGEVTVCSGNLRSLENSRDYIFGAYHVGPNRLRRGAVYVRFSPVGKAPDDDYTLGVEPLERLDADHGIIIQGEERHDELGRVVSTGGGPDEILVITYRNGMIIIPGGHEVFSANSLSVSQGQTVRLGATDLAVEPFIGARMIYVSDVEHGYFMSINHISSSFNISRFTQQQVSDGEIYFVSDRSNQSPQYTVRADRASRIFRDVPPQRANISFEPWSRAEGDTSTQSALTGADVTSHDDLMTEDQSAWSASFSPEPEVNETPSQVDHGGNLLTTMASTLMTVSSGVTSLLSTALMVDGDGRQSTVGIPGHHVSTVAVSSSSVHLSDDDGPANNGDGFSAGTVAGVFFAGVACLAAVGLFAYRKRCGRTESENLNDRSDMNVNPIYQSYDESIQAVRQERQSANL